MFRFSDYYREVKDLSDLLAWLEHFKDRGVPAGLVQVNGDFAVWREGKARHSKAGLHNGSVLLEDRPQGKVIISVNNFERLWSGRKRLKAARRRLNYQAT